VAHSLVQKRVRQNLQASRATGHAGRCSFAGEDVHHHPRNQGLRKKAEEALAKAVAVMDKVAVKGTIHPRAASRAADDQAFERGGSSRGVGQGYDGRESLAAKIKADIRGIRHSTIWC
jgi:hypothetical protein